MAAFAALVLLAAQVGGGSGTSSNASLPLTRAPPPENLMIQTIKTLDGATWPRRVVRCARELGFARCLKAFAVCRGERAVDAAARGTGLQFHLREDLEDLFPWEHYLNTSEKELDARLLEYTTRLFSGRDVLLSYPGGIRLDVHSNTNGSLQLDVKKAETAELSGRGRGSRWRRLFYRFVPLALIPPLIMAAILPFKLPAFMMLSMGAVMLNNMALTGSIFTLLRNNAFDDNYEKKVIYVNDGYKNEESAKPVQGNSFQEAPFQDFMHDGGYMNGGFRPGYFGSNPDDFSDAGFMTSDYNNGYNTDGFSAASFPPEVFSADGFRDESVQGEHVMGSKVKTKKRRGHKHKKRPGKRKPVNQEEGWEGQTEFELADVERDVEQMAEMEAEKYTQGLLELPHGGGGEKYIGGGDGPAGHLKNFRGYRKFFKQNNSNKT